jgi:YidC/Oxa1 family membrane protein insertase
LLQTLRNIFDPLFDLMGGVLTAFHDFGAPWWLSIMMLTVVVRTLLFPLTVRQVKSMRKMQELQPEMQALREKHKDDPQKQQQELMKLYGERRVNPLGGCLPLFIQLPIFLVLYYTIKEFEALESFRTGGLLWFQDLTARDPYYILPILYVLTLMASQEITLKRVDPKQRTLMRVMPLAFGAFLFSFPAGLFVYWVTSNVISFVQNYLIYRNAPPSPWQKEQEEKAKAAANGQQVAKKAQSEGKAPQEEGKAQKPQQAAPKAQQTPKAQGNPKGQQKRQKARRKPGTAAKKRR